MGDEQIGIGTAIVKSLETEPVKNLLGPITEQLGLIGGDLGSLVRFYVNRNLEKIFRQWAKQRNNQPLPPDTDIGRLIPLIQQASLQSDEELQERWAALLESAVTEPDGVLPSFGQTLSQLTAEEARYIDRLYAHVNDKRFNRGRELGSENNLLGIYDELLERAMGLTARQELQKELAQARLLIHDLQRLRIITLELEPKRPTLNGNDLQAVRSFLKKLEKPELISSYSFTEYGLSFIRAVTPKQKPTQ